MSTDNLTCTCKKAQYECTCRIGKSKIIGHLLNRYFELSPAAHNAKSIWQWVKYLNFHTGYATDPKIAINVLKNNSTLRKKILKHVFQNLTTTENIEKVMQEHFSTYSHEGLFLTTNDAIYLLNLAFESNNSILWRYFFRPHNHFLKITDRGPDSYRHHMRQQAKQKTEIMAVWAKSNRSSIKGYKRYRSLYPKSKHIQKRESLQQQNTRKDYIKFLEDNRTLIENGDHWPTISDFSKTYLYRPENIKEHFGDEMLVKKALSNCHEMVKSKIPSLREIADLHCQGKRHESITILYASCLEIFRSRNSLASIDLRSLRALRTKYNMHYDGVSDNEVLAFQNEIDKTIFVSKKDKILFLQEYIEPQLNNINCTNEHIEILDNEIFDDLKSTLTINWLRKYENTSISGLRSLFDLAARFSTPSEIREVIKFRSKDIMNHPLPSTDPQIETKRAFWLVREWFFIDIGTVRYWDYFRQDKQSIFALEHISGSFHRDQNPSWPQLSSQKIEAVLNAYIDEWPKVHLPSSYGTGSPEIEVAYRYLTEIVWTIGKDHHDEAIPVINRLLADSRYIDFHNNLKSINATQQRNKALSDYEPPVAGDIVRVLEHDEVVSVGGLRNLLKDELSILQKEINGSEFDIRNLFFNKTKSEIPTTDEAKYTYEHKDENECTLIIADRLRVRLESKDIVITPEHQLANRKRSDFTAAKIINHSRKLLVTEVKGQWHKDLFSAASAQLHTRYANHPQAEDQGVYLVLWFGKAVEVANRKNHNYSSASELQQEIETLIPDEIANRTTVFVLDLSSR